MGNGKPLYVGDFKEPEVDLIHRAMEFLVTNDLIRHLPNARSADVLRAKLVHARAGTWLDNQAGKSDKQKLAEKFHGPDAIGL